MDAIVRLRRCRTVAVARTPHIIVVCASCLATGALGWPVAVLAAVIEQARGTAIPPRSGLCAGRAGRIFLCALARRNGDGPFTACQL